jgi:predicted site-specific integrase-resolvase
MPVEIDGCIYYRTMEICSRANISRATFFRWLKSGILEKRFKDRRGWGLYTEEDLERIRTEARKMKVEIIDSEKKDG